jgi:hypothetical protein
MRNPDPSLRSGRQEGEVREARGEKYGKREEVRANGKIRRDDRAKAPAACRRWQDLLKSGKLL